MSLTHVALSIILALAAVALVACGVTKQQAANLAVAANQSAAIQQEWSRVEELYEQHADALDESRREDLDRAMDELGSVVMALEVDNPRQVLDNVDRAREMYGRARDAYEVLRPAAQRLIEAGAITGADADALRRLDERAQDLDERIAAVGDAADANTLELLGIVRDVLPVVGRLVLRLA